MKMFVRVLSVLLVLLLLAMPVFAEETPADVAPEETEKNESAEKTEVPEVQPPKGDWQPSCVSAPYLREYEDENMWITMEHIEKDNLTYYVVDVQLTDPSHFLTAMSSGRVNGRAEKLSEMAEREEAVLAINADNYGDHKYGIIIRNGKLIRAKRTSRNLLIVDENGDFTVHADRRGDDHKKMAQDLEKKHTWQTFEFGPELVRDGALVEVNDGFDVINTKASHKEPRTAIGQIDTLHYVIIIADGRGDSKGLTLPALAQLFIDYGAQTAMNLDGGGSTELWLQGEIINEPSGNKERSMYDIIYFK